MNIQKEGTFDSFICSRPQLKENNHEPGYLQRTLFVCQRPGF